MLKFICNELTCPNFDSIKMKEMIPNEPKLIYVGDPMCSWCYGFSNSIATAVDTLKSTTSFELVMGGLRPYNTEIISNMKEFLKEHWEHVEKQSGMEFSYDILDNKTFRYDTEPPCRAVVTMRYLEPQKEFEFFKAVQTAFYLENKDTSDVQTYIDIADKIGVQSSTFKETFESEAMKQAVKLDFELSSQLGVSGFPTTLLQNKDKLSLVSNGYTTADKIIDRVNKLLGG